jgi:hypothetical protein
MKTETIGQIKQAMGNHIESIGGSKNKSYCDVLSLLIDDWQNMRKRLIEKGVECCTLD